jgi:hypothetical protein
VTVRQLTQRKFLHNRFSGGNRQPSAAQDPPLKEISKERDPQWSTRLLPTRPDDTVLSDSIPLFFIGRNQNGFWVARESAGRCGGLFLFRWSAARFARRNGLAGGGATMLVEHPIELDLRNQGSRFAALMAILAEAMSRRAPRVANLMSAVIAQLRSFI